MVVYYNMNYRLKNMFGLTVILNKRRYKSIVVPKVVVPNYIVQIQLHVALVEWRFALSSPFRVFII